MDDIFRIKPALTGLGAGVVIGAVTLVIFWYRFLPEFAVMVSLYTLCCGALPGALAGLAGGIITGYLAYKLGWWRWELVASFFTGIILGLLAGVLGVVISVAFSP